MKKKWLLALLSLAVIAVIAFVVFRPSISLEQRICTELAKQYGECDKIIFIDANANLVFAENQWEIMPVLTNEPFTKIIKMIHPLDFQEYKEENRQVSWQVDNHLLDDFSMISGFASDEVKTIVIDSEGGVQPNKFFIRDNLWFWYMTFPQDELILPADVKGYNADGQIIFGGDEEE